jgi:hypothetical protein
MVEPTIITDEGSIVLRLEQADTDTNVLELVTIHKDQISQKFLKASVSGNTKVVDSAPEDDTEEDTDEGSEAEAETKYNNLVAHIPKALRDHMPDFYLKPLFRAKGIDFGTLRPKDEEPQDDVSENNDEPEETPQIPTQDGVPKQKSNRVWVPKLFRRKQQATQEVGPYF